MKSSINKIISSELITTIRNSLNIKSIKINKYYSNQSLSITDAFLFRTDANFKTIFRFSDIPKIYHHINDSTVEIIFYNYKNELIKKIDIDNIKKVNELIIDKKFLDNVETYGHFYFFHKIKNIKSKKILLSNRCYLGFSKNGKNQSFVHGNSFVKGKNFENGDIVSNFVKKSFFQNHKYYIQENFSDIDKVELFINNPTNKKIKFIINNINHILMPDNDTKIELSNIEKIEIHSNCTLLRPIIFTFKDEYYDVHHA